MENRMAIGKRLVPVTVLNAGASFVLLTSFGSMAG
jgi:hypothetical protein